jgi:hypothetical protein
VISELHWTVVVRLRSSLSPTVQRTRQRVEPLDYLSELFKQLPTAMTVEAIEALPS